MKEEISMLVKFILIISVVGVER